MSEYELFLCKKTRSTNRKSPRKAGFYFILLFLQKIGFGAMSFGSFMQGTSKPSLS